MKSSGVRYIAHVAMVTLLVMAHRLDRINCSPGSLTGLFPKM